VIAALWGVIVFKEIRGSRNFAALAFAFLLTFIGVGLTAVSNS
jgi:glucose uptake protein GlcU